MADQDSTAREIEAQRLYQALANEPMVIEGLHDAAVAIAARTNHGTSPWQPIETAPKNGLPVLLGSLYGWVIEGYFALDECEWRERNNHPTDSWGSPLAPTHWMPLPPPPQED